MILTFCSDAEAADDYNTRLCIERPGETGHVNIAPVTIRVMEMGEFTISGEHEICVGENSSGVIHTTISLKFPYPYWGAAEKLRMWETQPVPVSIKPGRTTRLLLCERNQNHNSHDWISRGWHQMWILLSPEKRDQCAM